jgi:transcriptional regulator of heat shock response
MTEKNSNFSLNDETLTNVELLHDEQHQNFLIIDSSSEDDVENPTLKLTLRQTFQTWDEAEKFLNDYALEKGLAFGGKELKIMMIKAYEN